MNPESEMEIVTEEDIPGFKDKFLAYWESQQPKWWLKRCVLIASFFLHVDLQNRFLRHLTESTCQNSKESFGNIVMVMLNEPRPANLCLRAFRHDKF